MAQRSLTLLRTNSELSSPTRQKKILGGSPQVPLEHFGRMVSQVGCVLVPKLPTVYQINVGKRCNQTCAHCHVDAGPDRRESLNRNTAERAMSLLDYLPSIETVDITGGAPELNANFRWLVSTARQRGLHVIDRCNLTILTVPGFEDLPDFLAAHDVEVVASLPCYLAENCDRQRGEGVFEQSIKALQNLNQLGYGKTDGRLKLNLVFNPTGLGLPPSQAQLETEYRRELRDRFAVEFDHLYAIANMPISRFLDDLLRQGKFDEYLGNLIGAFNPQTLDGLMCRNTLSVDWLGNLFDCDFNQMLDLPIGTIGELATEYPQLIEKLQSRRIRTGNHCFGCTAGNGSSCQGATIQIS